MPANATTVDCLKQVIEQWQIRNVDLGGCCRWCQAPSQQFITRLCPTCRALLRRTERPLDTLEFVLHARREDLFHGGLRRWKDQRCRRRPYAPYGHPAEPFAALLSAYIETHRDRLLAADPLVVATPTTAPLIVRAFRFAAARRWFSIDVRSVATRIGGHAHRGATRSERLRRCAEDYAFFSEVNGPVLLFDDVYVTGATLHSFAQALRHRGASEVRGVVLERYHGAHADYEPRFVKPAWDPAESQIALERELGRLV